MAGATAGATASTTSCISIRARTRCSASRAAAPRSSSAAPRARPSSCRPATSRERWSVRRRASAGCRVWWSAAWAVPRSAPSLRRSPGSGLVAKRRDSAGLVIFRRKPVLAFLLVHPGGPYWTRKDDGAWSIPKGEIEAGEDKFVAARRETEEETGFALSGKFMRLAPVRQPSGKVIHAWAIEADGLDPAAIKS